ncbi:MAG: hypothetical protein JSR97_01350 [Verrucomicrobia bacterium]|nr:hypothetical protein [Verrucomicrobiota bacterium]
MLDILQQGDYKIVHLTDGELLSEAVKLIDKGKADGINLNYIRNWRTDLEPLRNSNTIKCLAVNDYPPSMQYDYSAVQTLTNLQHLAINTTDKKEIDFSAFPLLTSVALTWRPKAKSLFSCVQLQRLFLNRYTGQDLTELSSLKNLKFLRINLGSVISLRGLKEITTLEELMLMQTTKLEDIEDLLTLKHLKRLRIDNCKRVRNISAVKRMNILKLEIVGTTPDD